MLILSRKAGESIVIQTDSGVIEIAVVKVAGSRVKISVAAPRQVEVMRSELLPKASDK